MVTAIVTVAGFFVGRSLPRKYLATAVVQLDFDRYFEGAHIDPSLMSGTQENLSAMMVDMTGQEVLLRAARRMGRVVDTTVTSDVGREMLETVEAYREKIRLHPLVDSKRIEITVVSNNQSEAAALANAVGEAYQTCSYERKKERFDRRERKMRETLEKCTDELSAIAQRMIDVRKPRHGLIDIKYRNKRQEQTAMLERRLQETEYLLETIFALRGELHDLRGRLEQSKQQPSGGPDDSIGWLSDFDRMSELLCRDPGLESLNRRRIELRNERAEYLRYYRPSHPKIADINDKLVRTIDEIHRALDRNEASLQLKRREAAARQDLIADELGAQPTDENTLYRLQVRYASQEEWCESMEADLTDLQAAAAGLVPFVYTAVKAERPRSPRGFGMGKMIALSLAIGLALGVFLSIVREMADTSLSTIEDVRRVLPGCVILAVLPRITAIKEGVQPAGQSSAVFEKHFRKLLPVLFDPAAPAADSFRLLGAQLSPAKVNRELKTMLVASSINQEGKTIVAANLALALALQGKQVALVEADFRRPSMASLFGLPALPGLMQILIEEKKVHECSLTVGDLVTGAFPMEDVVKAHGIDNFTLIPFGSFPPNPVELIASPAMHRLLRELAGDYDAVILDSPPVMPVADPVLLARRSDGVIMVYRSDRAPRDVLKTALRRLEDAGASLLGLVLNGWRVSAADADSGAGAPGAPV